jgi:hypothetical protein
MKFSGLREDTEHLALIGRADPSSLDFVASKPLLVLPYGIGQVAVDDPMSFLDALRVSPLSFGVLYNVTMHNPEDKDVAYDATAVMYLAQRILDEDGNIISSETKPFAGGLLAVVVPVKKINAVFSFAYVPHEGNTIAQHLNITHYEVNGRNLTKTILDDDHDDVRQGVLDNTFQITENLKADFCLFTSIATQKDQYPVLVQPVNGKPKKGSGPVAKRVQLGPKLIYLNRLPAPPKPSQGGHHASPRRHQRRGFYKTLKHPKFQNHPKYGVEKGVYVRPAWVGDTECVYEGNRYTVILPADNG